MQSTASTVAAYLDEQPEEHRPTLRKLRALIRKSAKSAKESMQYGMPAYHLGKKSLCAFALQKGYLALYFDPPLVARFKAELGTKDCGKSCIRYRKPEAVPLPVIERMLREAVGPSNTAEPKGPTKE